MKKNKNVLILFSGGLDSTYLIWKNLKEGNNIFPVYVELDNNINKSIVEKQEIKLLHEKFVNEFGFGRIQPIHFVTKLGIYGSYQSPVNFPQPILWIFSLIFSINKYIDEIQIGYVINDDAISFINEIKNVYRSLKPFMDYQKPIKFPLIKETKFKLIDELPKKYLSHVTSCENPNLTKISVKNKNNGNKYTFYKPCGGCISCKKIINNNYFGSQIIKNKYIEFNKELERIETDVQYVGL